jgi:hypothetical protein
LGRKNPAASEALKKKWQDPEFRAKQAERLRHQRGSRIGIPDGMRRAQAQPLWDLAEQKAKYLMEELEKAGVIEFDPNLSDDQMAKAALQEAFKMALSPLTQAAVKTSSIRTVLEWTRAKPASKADLRINSAETWLAGVIADHDAETGQGE